VVARESSKPVIDSFVARLGDEITTNESGLCKDMLRISLFRTMDTAGGSNGNVASNSTTTGNSSATRNPSICYNPLYNSQALNATQSSPPLGRSLSIAHARVFVP